MTSSDLLHEARRIERVALLIAFRCPDPEARRYVTSLRRSARALRVRAALSVGHGDTALAGPDLSDRVLIVSSTALAALAR